MAAATRPDKKPAPWVGYAEAFLRLEDKTFRAVYPLVRGYIMARFLLTEDMCAADSILDLADESLRHILALKKLGKEPEDIPRSCAGAASVITKKILLMKAIREDFRVDITPELSAGLTTVTELSEYITAVWRDGPPHTGALAPEDGKDITPPVGGGPAGFPAETIRADFPALSGSAQGQRLVYLDNAATAQMPRQVMEAVAKVELRRGGIHRSVHTLGEECSAAYEDARAVCAAFLGAQAEKLVFTAGTTDGINRVAAVYERNAAKGVMVTALEHHSNFIPWQQLCRRKGLPFHVLSREDVFSPERVERRLAEQPVGLLAVTQCSNVTGEVLPVGEICRIAHRRGIKVLVDGAQSVCHMDVNVNALDCDWFVCSGHKLGGPSGIGLLYCKEPLAPAQFGGGMAEAVTWQETTFLPMPHAAEAGTPNVSGAVGLAEAIRYRNDLPSGWREHERGLLARLESELARIPGVSVLGDKPRVGCISFVPEKYSPLDAALLLDRMGIAVRSGNLCAQPHLKALGQTHVLRVSPAFYNTDEDITALTDALARVRSLL